jgi:hypothetical protein
MVLTCKYCYFICSGRLLLRNDTCCHAFSWNSGIFNGYAMQICYSMVSGGLLSRNDTFCNDLFMKSLGFQWFWHANVVISSVPEPWWVVIITNFAVVGPGQCRSMQVNAGWILTGTLTGLYTGRHARSDHGSVSSCKRKKRMSTSPFRWGKSYVWEIENATKARITSKRKCREQNQMCRQ